MRVRAHIFVYGRVQGVFFRYGTYRLARNLGVIGWVRNLPDGGVEAVIQGQDDSIEQMIELLQEGPGASIVTDLKIEEIEQEEFSGFTMRF